MIYKELHQFVDVEIKNPDKDVVTKLRLFPNSMTPDIWHYVYSTIVQNAQYDNVDCNEFGLEGVKA